MSMIFLRKGLLLAAIVPALLTAGCAADSSGQAMKGAASPPTAPTSDMSPTDTGSPTTGASPTETGGTGAEAASGVVEKFYGALESGNADEAAKLFSTDAVAAVDGKPTAEGTQALTSLFQDEKGQGGSPTIEEAKALGRAAFVRATSGEAGDETRAFFVLTQQDGDWKISRYITNSAS